MKCYICENEASLIGREAQKQIERINCPVCHQYRVGDSFRDFYKRPLSQKTRLKLQHLIKNHPDILLEARDLEGDGMI